MLSTLVVVLVLAGSFAFTFALMRAIQAMGGFDDPSVQRRRGAHFGRAIAVPVGPDDDLAFLRDLRRRIDLGHFRR